MAHQSPAGPIPAILPDADLISIGGIYLRLSSICYAQATADGGIILYLNNGRLHLSRAQGAAILIARLNQQATVVEIQS